MFISSCSFVPLHKPLLIHHPFFHHHPSPPPLSKQHSISISSSLNNPTLFPGGFKRPSINTPTLLLRLTPDQLNNNNNNNNNFIDNAVKDKVGIVVLTIGNTSGKLLYEAACLLKSILRDRAYLLILDRVDVSVAVSASGVLLSQQGLPTIVARNTMLDGKMESRVLPLIGREVKTYDEALQASVSEGADFIVFSVGGGDSVDVGLVSSVASCVKIPVFVMVDSVEGVVSRKKYSELLRSGASGLVVTLDELKLFYKEFELGMEVEDEGQSFEMLKTFDMVNGSYLRKNMDVVFTKLEERRKELIERERTFLLQVVNVILRATPQMGDISLLKDAVSQLDDPFLLVIVGEFNSGKSSVINAFLGQRYLKDGVVPTTNEITFLRYSKSESTQQLCERYPDGQYICYLPAPILKEMIIVDTPGTNVILQRQQRLTEEFVPRADLLFFVMSADRPLTESEVTFLRYIQKWEKKIVFVLNKSDIYQTEQELEEAVAFIKENTRKMLNVKDITLYPVSARAALDMKVSAFSSNLENQEESFDTPRQRANKFVDLEKYLYSFLDGTTSNGIERIKLKLETPVKIAERLISACQHIVREECQQAERDLASVNDLVSSVQEYALKMEYESISWKRQILSLIDNALARAINLADSTLRLSNLDLVTSYVFKGDKSTQLPVTSSLRNHIIDPALIEAEKLLREYAVWLESSNARKGNIYKESFEKRWPSVFPSVHSQFTGNELLRMKHELGIKVIEDFSTAAASKLFEQEIREVLFATYGGLGAAGLSASLLTSILPTTLEDLLALGICSAGGLVAVSNFPSRRRGVVDKVRRTADALSRQLDEAMQKDLLETISGLKNFVTLISKPYQDMAQDRVNKLSGTLDELRVVEEKLKVLQVEIQNLHVSR